MVNISSVTSLLGIAEQQYKPTSFDKDKSKSDDPYADKVSLSDGQQEPELTYLHLAKNTNSSTSGSEDTSKQNEKSEPVVETDRLAKMMQQVLDSKLGIDRKKLEEIDEKIKALTEKEGELTDAEQSQLEMLQKQKEQLIKDGTKKLTEEH